MSPAKQQGYCYRQFQTFRSICIDTARLTNNKRSCTLVKVVNGETLLYVLPVDDLLLKGDFWLKFSQQIITGRGDLTYRWHVFEVNLIYDSRGRERKEGTYAETRG